MKLKSSPDTEGGNPLSPGDSTNGWTRVETEGDGIGPGKGDAIPKSVSKLPMPRILTQKKKYSNSTPINLHRKEISRSQYPEIANPSAYVGLGQPNSQGVGQYFYAPNEGNLGQNVATRAGLLLADGGRGGDGGGLVTGPVDSKDQWSDSDMVVELGKDGYPRYDSDSNFARRPKTWRFRTKDKDVSMFPQKNQTSSPEAPSQFDIGNESLFYPIQGRLKVSSEGEGVPLHKYGTPEPVGSYTPGDNEVLFQVPVYSTYNDGSLVDKEPFFDIRFWMYADPKSPGKAYLNTNLAAEAYEYPAGELAYPEGAGGKPIPPIDLDVNTDAQRLVQNIPVKVLMDAAKTMGLEYKGAESKTEEHAKAVTDVGGYVSKNVNIEDLAKKISGLRTYEKNSYLRTLGKQIIKDAGNDLPGATFEDVVKVLQEELVKYKVEHQEETQKAEAEAKQAEADAEAKKKADAAEVRRVFSEAEAKKKADEAEAKRIAAEAEAKKKADEAEAEKTAAEWVSPDFRKVSIADLGKYMYKDHRAIYEKAAESEQNQVRKLALENIGDASKLDENTVKERLGEIVDKDLKAPEKQPERKEGEAKKAEDKRKMPEGMLPQELLFRDVAGWQDDYQTFSGSDLEPDVISVLEKQPEGAGKYFKWQFVKAENPDDSVLVVFRNPAWKEFQGEK
jgi:hypothetical protein